MNPSLHILYPNQIPSFMSLCFFPWFFACRSIVFFSSLSRCFLNAQISHPLPLPSNFSMASRKTLRGISDWRSALSKKELAADRAVAEHTDLADLIMKMEKKKKQDNKKKKKKQDKNKKKKKQDKNKKKKRTVKHARRALKHQWFP